jgi:hypothetical protein
MMENQVSDLREFEVLNLSKELGGALAGHNETLSPIQSHSKEQKEPDSPQINVLKSIAKKQIKFDEKE